MRTPWLLALAACGGVSSAPQAPVESHPEAPSPPRRTTPAPTVGWDGKAFQAQGLPAIARGREIAVLAMRDNDTGRGFPNLRLEVRDLSDKLVETIPVMGADEYETLITDGKPTATLQHRLDAANGKLAQLHDLHDLVAMHPLEVQPPAENAEKHLAIGDGLDVDWSGDHLHVFHHNSDHSIVLRETKGWLAPDHKPCAQCEMCTNPAFLAATYHATEINALVVEIGYQGTDTCWEPSDQLHVVVW